MLENILVATFTDEKKAIEGLHKLNELAYEGDITLFDHALVRRNSEGVYEVLKEDTTNGWRTLAGMTIGGLIGLIGGPVGVGIGLYAGAAIGAIGDIHNYSFEKDFADKVKKDVPAGTTAIIAEVDEDSAVFIDTYLKPLGAEITRSNIFVEHDKYVDKRVKEINAEIESLENKFDAAVESEKEEIRGKIEELKNKRDKTISELKAEANETIEELKDKIDSNGQKLKEQIFKLKAKVSGELDASRKAVIEKRIEIIENLIDRYDSRLEELNERKAELKLAQAG